MTDSTIAINGDEDDGDAHESFILDRNAEKVSEYCGANRNMALMQAVEVTLGAGK